MPRQIPTYTSDGRVPTSRGPSATAAAFGGGGVASFVAQALGSAAQGIGNVGLALQDKRQKTQSAADQIWVAEQMSNVRLESQKFLSDPANAGSISLDTDFEAFSASFKPSKSAPSPEASQMFQQKLGDYITSRREQTIAMQSRNIVAQAERSLSEQVPAMIQEFREGIKNGSDATSDLVSNLAEYNLLVDSTFGSVDSKLADRFKHDATVEAIYALADHNPEVATQVLEASTTLSGRERTTLKNHIKSSIESSDESARYTFDQMRRDTLATAAAGNLTEKIPLNQYTLFMDKDKAVVVKQKDDAAIDLLQNVQAKFDNIAALTPQHKAEALNRLRGQVNSEASLEEFEELSQRVVQDAKLFAEDKVGWLHQNNPEIRSLVRGLDQASDDERAAQLLILNDTILKYQGRPDEGLPASEKKKYMGLPALSQQIMSTPQATEDAAFINQGSPGEVMNRIQQILERYPSSDQRAKAIKDLATLPKEPVKQEYLLALQNDRNPYLQGYLNALSKSGDLQTLSGAERSKITTAVRTNPDWMAFSSSMLDGDFSRANELSGYLQGLSTYAIGLMQDTKVDQDEAVELSVQRMLNYSVGYTEFKGSRIAVSRIRADGTTRTNADISSIGQNLESILSRMDPDMVDDSSFLGLDAIPKARRSSVLDFHLQRNAQWEVAEDGESAILHILDDGGRPIEIRDKSGLPIQVYFDDLSSVVSNTTRTSGPGISGPTGFITAETAKRLFSPKTLKDIPKRTNFPIR